MYLEIPLSHRSFRPSDSDEIADDFHECGQFFQNLPQLESARCLSKDYMGIMSVGEGRIDHKSKISPFTHQTEKYVPC